MSKVESQPSIAPPAATANAGVAFEVRVGAYYALTMLSDGEPRGLVGAKTTSVGLQQRIEGHPLDDIVVKATNPDGTDATLEIQAKRTLTFTSSDEEFSDVAAQLWQAAQKPEFTTQRYELAVAMPRTTTKIEQVVQEVLHWARHLPNAHTFMKHIARQGFASKPMRDFVDVFRRKLASASAPSDDETVWTLLRRFQVLVFDFESAGSDYEHRARERSRLTLAADQANRAGDLWTRLFAEVEGYARAAGQMTRPELMTKLSNEHGLRFEALPDLRQTMALLSESADFALGEIDDDIGGARLARTSLIEEARGRLEESRVLYLSGAPGTGKSSIMKHLAQLLRPQGQIIVLSNGRIIPGGWLAMARAIRCNALAAHFFNEIGSGGGATLFVDNIDQIEDARDQATVRDLLEAVATYRGWRAVVTGGDGSSQWKALLPQSLRDGVAVLSVPDISDEEAEQLANQNTALAALLDGNHPAKSIARNLFFLSQMATLGPSEMAGVATEIDLARIWWSYGGGRGQDEGRWRRLKALRAMGADILTRPTTAASKADTLESAAISELLRLGAVREHVKGAEIAFRHDVLRDWTIGFMFDEDSKRLHNLGKSDPIPASLARALETFARITLQNDPSGKGWLTLLESVSSTPAHGSWRRHVLLALLRSENFARKLEALEQALLAEDGRLLIDLVRLMTAIESEPVSQWVARLPSTLALPSDVPDLFVPKGYSWHVLMSWLLANSQRLPHQAIPDAAKAFFSWLIVTQSAELPLNTGIVALLFDWLALVDEALRPRMFRPDEELPERLEIPHMADARDQLRMAAFTFARLNPASAQNYLSAVRTQRHSYREFESLLRASGTLAKAAPKELAALVLECLLPQADDRKGRYRDSSFRAYNDVFSPASPSRGPLLSILEADRNEGLLLVRQLVEHVTEWRRSQYRQSGTPFPCVSIHFPDGTKSFEGDQTIYLFSRNESFSCVATSALLALEAWGHGRIENGESPKDILDDILGPNGSSCAFLAVGVDLVLSHWEKMRDTAWPMFAAPEVLELDFHRHTRDMTGVDRLLPFEREPVAARIKRADLDSRQSRRTWLLACFPYYVFHAQPQIIDALSQSLNQAASEIDQRSASDEDPLNGLHAIAARAVRMLDRGNWRTIQIPQKDGTVADCVQFIPHPAEERLFSEKSAEVMSENQNLMTRVAIEKALFDPAQSTPDLVLDGIAWAKRQAENLDPTTDDSRDSFEVGWDRRAVVMAAALAARDYRGDDRSEIVTWAEAILSDAAEEPETERYGNNQIQYSVHAIAALGLFALYREDGGSYLQRKLLQLAAHPDLAVTNALGDFFAELNTSDDRLLRTMIRAMLFSARYPRRGDTEAENDRARQSLAKQTDDAISAELAWLTGNAGEPEWPRLPPWRTRPRRRIRLPGGRTDEKPRRQQSLPPDAYADERRLGEVVSHLIRLTVGEMPPWLLPLTEHLMAWTLAANSVDDDGRDSDGRPVSWNLQFFDYLGILCAALPPDHVVTSFLEPLSKLGDEAFHEAAAALLRGFDRAVLSIDATKPKDPAWLRAAMVGRFMGTWNYRRAARDKEFTTEIHAGDAYSALFFQQSGLFRSSRPSIPDNWPALDGAMPILTNFVVGAPTSGYLALLFLNLIETAPRGSLLPFLVDAHLAWCNAYGPDTNFWVSKDIGGRVCTWLRRVLPFGGLDPECQAVLLKSLDTLVQAGVTSARPVEELLLTTADSVGVPQPSELRV